jgi:nucleoside-diphosphate-sugar epimerase
MKILVTGGSGFIGQQLCRRLQRDGHEVHATSRKPMLPNGTGPRWHPADLADLSAACKIVAHVEPEVIFHLAGAVGAGTELSLVLPTFQSLLTSTVNLLLAAKKVGCKRIILSGSLTEPFGADVGMATPQAPYAAAKWAAACYGRMFYGLYSTPVIVLRPFMTYGPGQAHTKLVPSVTLSLLRRERPRLSSGKYCSDWVYISDVIEGFVAAATAPGIEGKTIDLGSGTLIPLRDIVNRLVAIVGNGIEAEFGALPDRPGENTRCAATLLAAQSLGWRTTTSLESGLQQTVDWYRSHN